MVRAGTSGTSDSGLPMPPVTALDNSNFWTEIVGEVLVGGGHAGASNPPAIARSVHSRCSGLSASRYLLRRDSNSRPSHSGGGSPKSATVTSAAYVPTGSCVLHAFGSG